MQPAAMELLKGMQQALGSSTGLVLADTHSSNHLHNPVKKIDCSGLAANNASGRSWWCPLSSSCTQQRQVPLLGS